MKHINAKVDPETTSAALRARLFGPTELVADGRQIFLRDWPGRKARSLLFLLLDSPRHQLPRDRVLDLLWPDFDPESAANALYKALHAVRRVLEPTLQSGRKSRFVETHEETIALAATVDVWTDFEAFASLIERAEQQEPDEQRRLYRAALAYVHGDYIADEPYADWVMTRRTTIRADVARFTLRLAALDLEAGEPLASVTALEALLVFEPTHDSAQQALMRAYASAGLRSDALKQFERFRELLRREYDEEPDTETARLARSIRASFSSSPPPGAQENPPGIDVISIAHRMLRHLAPALPTPTVGRERELAALSELIDRPDVRLVTVTGTGGVGKTRLVRQIALTIQRQFPGEIVYVPLAALRDAAMLMAAVGAALGLVEDPARAWKEVVIARLRPATTLLVLDNLEQIVDAGQDIAELIEACPTLTTLTTSRTPLRIRAEHCFKLDVLPLPTGDASSIDEIRAFGATALFLQTFEQLHQHHVEIADDDLIAITAICRRLDGLPLAIEIAASHCYERTPTQIFTMLQERARLYVLRDGPRDLPERHRTLLDLIEWSYELLSGEAKRVFRAMSVFAGGIEQDALTAVAGDDAWQIARELADHNLVSWNQINGIRRLEMLETVREVAQILLDTAGTVDHIRDRHLAFYAEFAHESESGMRGPFQRTYFDRLARDFPNIRAALSFAAEGEANPERYDSALAIMAGTWLFWYYRGHVHEGVIWLDRLSATPTTVNLPALRKVYLAQIIAGRRIQDDERVQRYLDLIEVANAGADLDSVTIMVKIQRGIISRERGELAESMELLLDAVRMSEALHDSWTFVEALTELSTTHLLLGQFSSALEVLDRAGETSRKTGDLLSEANALSFQAVAAFHSGDFAHAHQIAIEAERLCRLIENRIMLPWTLYVQAAEAFTAGEFQRAMELLQELRLLFADLGNPRNIASVEISLGAALSGAGDLAAAGSTFHAAIPAIRQYGFSEDKTMCLFEVAFFAAASGQHKHAVQLLAASEAHAGQIGQTLSRADEQRKSGAQSSLRAILRANVFDIEWTAGLNLTLDDAFALAQRAGDERAEMAS